jgi:hypothetical protein
MGALILQPEQTALIFVGVPLAVIAIVAGLVYAGSRSRAKRYRPGRAYDYAPVWFTAAARPTGGTDVSAARAAIESADRAALPTAGPGDTVAKAMAVSAPGVTGGASDRW